MDLMQKFFNSANLEKEKIENQKQVLVQQEETIFNLSRQIRELLTNYEQLNIEIDQFKDLLVKKSNYKRINLISDLIQTISICKNGNRSQLKLIITRSSSLMPELIRDQQRLRYLIKRIEDIEKQLGKNTKNNQQEEMLSLSVKLTFNQKLLEIQKTIKIGGSKNIQRNSKNLPYQIRSVQKSDFKESHTKNKFPDSLPYQKDRGNQPCQKSQPLQTG